jgi:hypothetical protein
MIMDPFQSRRLTGKHALLYRESLGMMLDVFRDCLFDGDDRTHWVFEVALFDGLLWKQQICYLARVSMCVLEGPGDPEEWSAIEKAAFYAVYHNVYQQLEIERDLGSMDAKAIQAVFSDKDLDLDDEEQDPTEFDDDYDLSWEEMIAAAYREKCQEDGLTLEEIESHLQLDPDGDNDLFHWHALLESLADQILDDRDFEMAPTLMDADPAIASMIKKELGITPDYFVETADEPLDAMVPRLFQELSELAGLPPLDDPKDAPY